MMLDILMWLSLCALSYVVGRLQVERGLLKYIKYLEGELKRLEQVVKDQDALIKRTGELLDDRYV